MPEPFRQPITSSPGPLRGAARLFASGVVGCALASALPALAADGDTLPYTLAVDVYYTTEGNREIYREEIHARIINDLIAGECYEAIATRTPGAPGGVEAVADDPPEGSADLVLEIGIGELEISEDRRIVDDVTGGGSVSRLLGARSHLRGQMLLRTASGTLVLPARRLYAASVTTSSGPLSDPTARTLEELYRDLTGRVRRKVCARRERLAGKIEAALAGDG